MKFCVPRDGDDKQESPSPVEYCVPLKGGRGPPLAGRGFLVASYDNRGNFERMVRDFDRLYDEGESVVLDLSTVHTHGPPSLPGKDKNIVSSSPVEREVRECRKGCLFFVSP